LDIEPVQGISTKNWQLLIGPSGGILIRSLALYIFLGLGLGFMDEDGEINK
jgi:hypothetical protein